MRLFTKQININLQLFYSEEAFNQSHITKLLIDLLSMWVITLCLVAAELILCANYYNYYTTVLFIIIYICFPKMSVDP